MHRRLRRIFKESFIPVLLVVLGLGALLIFADFKASMRANQVVTINIQPQQYVADISEDINLSEAAISDPGEEVGIHPKLQEARMLVDQEKWSAAELVYSQLLIGEPSSLAYTEFAVLFIKQGKLDRANELLDKALAETPIHVNAFVNRGLIKARKGNLTQAIVDYGLALELVPHHFQANFNLGVAYYRLKQFEHAEKALQNAVELSGGADKAKALYNLGLTYRNLGANKFHLAKKSFTQAIRIKPDYIEARFALASLEEQTADGMQRALEEYNKVLSLLPNFPPAYFRIASLHYNAGNITTALEFYQKALQYNPDYAKARYNLGLLYMDQRQWENAKASFFAVLALQPNNELAYFQLGRIAHEEKHLSLALEHYQKALEQRDGKYPKVLLNIGLVYNQLENYNKAVEYYTRAINLDPKYHQAWYNLGMVLNRQNLPAKAEQALLTAIQHYPNYEQAWFNLGVIYAKENRDKESINAYLKALEIEPNYIKAKLNLAVRYANANDYAKAIELYEQVIKQDDSYASAWTNLGIAHYKTGRYDLAETELVKALELEPANVNSLRSLARVYFQRNDQEKGISLLQSAVDNQQDDAGLRLELGLAYLQTRNKPAARKELEKASRLAPNDKDIKDALSKLE